MAVEDVVRKLLTQRFIFGYLSREDIAQELRVFAMEALSRHDPSRPLRPFLFAHCRNRAINLKRNLFHRTDAPCKNCNRGLPCQDGSFCKAFLKWKKRQATKANLAKPGDYKGDYPADVNKQSLNHEQKVENNDFFQFLEKRLLDELQGDFQLLKNGEKIKNPRSRKLLAEAVKTILDEAGLTRGDFGPRRNH